MTTMTTTTKTAPPASLPPPALPWFRCGALWLAVGVPALSVLASVAVAVLAWQRADETDLGPAVAAKAKDARAATLPTAPALSGRNHAATPRP